MPKCDGCANRRCSCVIVDGDGTTALGTGSSADPYRINIEGGGDGVSFFPGFITPYAGGSAPTGWLICDGSAVSRVTYSALFAICGETYGEGDSTTTFNLPDLGGRFALGADGAHDRGSIDGVEQITLTEANLPAHVHSMAHTHSINHDHANATSSSSGAHTHGLPNHKHDIKQSNDDGTNNATFRRGSQQDRLGETEAKEDYTTNSAGAHTHTVDVPGFSGNSGASSAANTGSVGSGTPITNMPPYTTITYLIKT